MQKTGIPKNSTLSKEKGSAGSIPPVYPCGHLCGRFVKREDIKNEKRLPHSVLFTGCGRRFQINTWAGEGRGPAHPPPVLY